MLNKEKGINIARKIIECAANHTTIFYSELMSCESIRTSRRYIGKYLAYIGNACLSNNLPILVALAINKAKREVSDSYYTAFPNNNAGEERAKCYQFNDFSALITYLDANWENLAD